MAGERMAEMDKSEKITINVGLVDLGQIDLLVDEGFYANRTDFIRTAIRRQLENRAAAVDDTVARRTLTLGAQHLSRRDLEQLRDAGQTVELRVLGLATIADDVTPELALATIPRWRSSAPSGRRGRSRPPWPPASHLTRRARWTGRSSSPARRGPTGPRRLDTPEGAPRWTTTDVWHVRSTPAHPRRAAGGGVRGDAALARRRTRSRRPAPGSPAGGLPAAGSDRIRSSRSRDRERTARQASRMHRR